MKVVLCLNHFLPDHVAGTEMYVYNLALGLNKNGVEVVIVIPNAGKNNNEEYLFDGFRVIRYAEASVVDRELIMGKRDPAGLRFFIDIIKKEDPGIVHFHELAGSNGLTYRHVEEIHKLGIRTVMTFHLSGYSCKTGHLMYKDKEWCDGIIRPMRCSSCYNAVKIKSSIYPFSIFPVSAILYAAGIDTSSSNSKLGTGLGLPFVIKKLKTDLHRLADHCDALITLTKWYQAILEKNGIGSDKIVHIAQGLTNQKPVVVTGNKTEGNSCIKIVFVGRISAFKGLHLLIEALSQIGPGKVQLDIFGADLQDDYSAALKQKTASMPGVSWKGLIAPGTISAMMSCYDLLCLPSTFSEMSPLVIPEAFAGGIPVLASDVYGNAEQIEDGKNGWLFRFNDAVDLKNKIEHLINDPLLIAQAKRSLPPVRSFEQVAEEQLIVYNKILSK